MCASDKDNDKVMPIAPPAGAKAGDVITFEGYTRKATISARGGSYSNGLADI